MKRNFVIGVCFAFFGCIGWVFYGSGTYYPPHPPKPRFSEISEEEIKYGEKLFEGTLLLGKEGSSCISCHASGEASPFRRSSLKANAKTLTSLINRCLKDPARSAGKPLQPGSREMVSLGAYLIAKYELPYEYIHYLQSLPEKRKEEKESPLSPGPDQKTEPNEGKGPPGDLKSNAGKEVPPPQSPDQKTKPTGKTSETKGEKTGEEQ